MPESFDNPETGDRPCGLFRRLLIMTYDAMVIIALFMLATAFAMLLGMNNYTAMKDPLYTAGLLAIWFLYLGWCWHHGGMTLGMRAWHVQIKNESGSLPGWGQCAIRFLTSFLSAAALGLGFLWSLFQADRRAWHDLASRTCLRRIQPAKARRTG